VRDNKALRPFAENRGYVPGASRFCRGKGLCLTPPELVSDGCVFAVNSRNW